MPKYVIINACAVARGDEETISPGDLHFAWRAQHPDHACAIDEVCRALSGLDFSAKNTDDAGAIAFGKCADALALKKLDMSVNPAQVIVYKPTDLGHGGSRILLDGAQKQHRVFLTNVDPAHPSVSVRLYLLLRFAELA